MKVIKINIMLYIVGWLRNFFTAQRKCMVRNLKSSPGFLKKLGNNLRSGEEMKKLY